MRINRMMVRELFLVALVGLGPLTSLAQAGPDSVAIHYHFAGTASFAGNTNFALAQRLCSLPSSLEFRQLALGRLAGVFWRDLNF